MAAPTFISSQTLSSVGFLDNAVTYLKPVIDSVNHRMYTGTGTAYYNGGSHTLYVIDTLTNTTIASYDISTFWDGSPYLEYTGIFGLALDVANNALYVSSFGYIEVLSFFDGEVILKLDTTDLSSPPTYLVVPPWNIDTDISPPPSLGLEIDLVNGYLYELTGQTNCPTGDIAVATATKLAVPGFSIVASNNDASCVNWIHQDWFAFTIDETGSNLIVVGFPMGGDTTSTVRKVSTSGFAVTVTGATVNRPGGGVVNNPGDHVYVLDWVDGSPVSVLKLNSSTLAQVDSLPIGAAQVGYPSTSYQPYTALTLDIAHNCLWASAGESDGTVYKINLSTFTIDSSFQAVNIETDFVAGIAIDTVNNYIYVQSASTSSGYSVVDQYSYFSFGFGDNGQQTHQRHDTGPTTKPVPHSYPINKWTTTKGIGMRRKWILGSIALAPNTFLELPCARLTTPVTFVPTEGDINTPWIVPNGVCQILVECQGDGNGFPNGNGSNGSDGVGGDGGPGGHGGGYGSSIINVVPGTIYNVNITEGSGAFFQTQFFVNIVAGYSGDDNIGGGLGDLVYNGNFGGGGSPGGPQVEDNNGPGGNGGMGGTSGYNSSGGLGGLGAGLNGIPPATSGTAGANYGGGGGGGGGGSGAGETPGFGGLGGLGFVRISWWGFYGLKSPRICGGG